MVGDFYNNVFYIQKVIKKTDYATIMRGKRGRTEMDKILLVEDEKRMQEIISDYFQVKDCKVICVNQGREALSILEKESFDLILLDVMMPEIDGFTVCKEVRLRYETPIIFITAKSDEEDQLYGYELGADDYVTKPFSLGVLYAKVNSLIKRAKGTIIEDKLKVNDICIDCKKLEVTVGGEEIKLAPMEYRMLVYFMRNKNQVITRDQLIVRLWGYDFEGNDRVIDTHVKKLRKALGKSGKAIRTIMKVGYKLEVATNEK